MVSFVMLRRFPCLFYFLENKLTLEGFYWVFLAKSDTGIAGCEVIVIFRGCSNSLVFLLTLSMHNCC